MAPVPLSPGSPGGRSWASFDTRRFVDDDPPPPFSPLRRKILFGGGAPISPPSPHIVSPALAARPIAAWGYAMGAIVPAEVHAAFEYYDANCSGYLDYLELQHALHGYSFSATIEECIDLVRQHDLDCDGKLNLHEFYSLLVHTTQPHVSPYALPHDLPAATRNAFAYYDANGSGYLDYLELQTALQGYGFDATVEECIELIRRYDRQRVGKLDPYSFGHLLHDLAPGPPYGVAPEPRLPLDRLRFTRPVYPEWEYVPPGESYRAPGTPAVPFARPILPSSVRPVFERHDADARGMLDAGHARDALLDLGCQMTLGEVAALVRRHGSFLPGINREDATVNFAQFLALLEYVRAAPLSSPSPPPRSPTRPVLHAVDIMPGPVHESIHGVEAGRPRWYGYSPLSA